MNLLGSGCSYSAADLAGECEVSIRTIYRDINDLSIHCTVYYDDGYRLLNIRETVVSPFKRTELLALRLAIKLPPVAETPYFGDAVRSASARIDELLSGYDTQGDDDRDFIDISIETTPLQQKTIRLLERFEKAIVGNQCLRARYISVSSGGETERTIAPAGIIFRRRNWYIIAHCFSRGEYRLFRANRFITVEETGENYNHGRTGLQHFFDNAWEMAVSGDIYDVSLVFEPRLAPLVESSYGHKGSIKHLRNGGILFETCVKGLFEIKNWIMRFGAGVKAEEPPELVAAIRDELEAMNVLYGVKND